MLNNFNTFSEMLFTKLLLILSSLVAGLGKIITVLFNNSFKLICFILLKARLPIFIIISIL